MIMWLNRVNLVADHLKLHPVSLTSAGIIARLTIATMVVTELIGCGTNGVNGARVQSELENEYQTIQQLPEATSRHRYHASHKAGQALVGDEYNTTLSYTNLRKHYDSELSKHGWLFMREEDVIYERKNYGGKHLFYRKGKYIADLQYAGDQEAQFAWTFVLSLSWGLFDG